MESQYDRVTKSSAIMLIFPTTLKMASNNDFPGPTYCQKNKCGEWLLEQLKKHIPKWQSMNHSDLTFHRPSMANFASACLCNTLR